MNLQEAYLVMQDNCGIEVGDTVRILRAAKDCETGWTVNWVSPAMDNMVNTLATVVGITGNGIVFEEHCYFYPFFVLELIKKGEEEKMVTVKGKEYSESTLQKDLEAYIK